MSKWALSRQSTRCVLKGSKSGLIGQHLTTKVQHVRCGSFHSPALRYTGIYILVRRKCISAGWHGNKDKNIGVISKLIFEDKWAKYDMVKLCFTRYLLLSLLFNVVGNKLKRFWKNLEMSYCHENRYFLYFYPTSNLEPRKCWGNERFAISPEQVCPAASPCWALSRSTPINAEPHISSLWAGGCECEDDDLTKPFGWH